jgi:hypothetical protein
MGWWWLVLWLSTGAVVPIVWLIELLVLHAGKRAGWAARLQTKAVSPVASNGVLFTRNAEERAV